MAIDNDLSALLPDPPPARPARREAAIEEALRRFDGGPPQAPVETRPEPGRSGGWGRPQIAALASVALVVLVSVPIWWTGRDRIIPQAPPAASPPAAVADGPAPPASGKPVAPTNAVPGIVQPSASPSPATPVGAPSAAPIATAAGPASTDARSATETSLARPTAPPAPPPAAAPAQRRAAAREEAEADAGQRIVVTGRLIQRQDFNSTTPIVAVDEAMLEQSSSAQGEWNACTLADPARNLEACRALADPAGRGAKGRAGAQLADGLTLAWQGDLDRAIAAFDRAIDAAPDLSIAYLNRGLAYQQKGNLRRALADLDRAVALDPHDGRAFYHRSQLQRARGNTTPADADARRAAEIGGN